MQAEQCNAGRGHGGGLLDYVGTYLFSSCPLVSTSTTTAGLPALILKRRLSIWFGCNAISISVHPAPDSAPPSTRLFYTIMTAAPGHVYDSIQSTYTPLTSCQCCTLRDISASGLSIPFSLLQPKNTHDSHLVSANHEIHVFDDCEMGGIASLDSEMIDISGNHPAPGNHWRNLEEQQEVMPFPDPHQKSVSREPPAPTEVETPLSYEEDHTELPPRSWQASRLTTHDADARSRTPQVSISHDYRNTGFESLEFASVHRQASERLAERRSWADLPCLEDDLPWHAFSRDFLANVQTSSVSGVNIGSPISHSVYESQDYGAEVRHEPGPMDDLPEISTFLHGWSRSPVRPGPGTIELNLRTVVNWLGVGHLRQGYHPNRDIQHLDWNSLGTDRPTALTVRAASYGRGDRTRQSRMLSTPMSFKNQPEFYTWTNHLDEWGHTLAHRQLRHTLAAVSRSDIFYAARTRVKRRSLAYPHAVDIIVDLSVSNKTRIGEPECLITTIAVTPPSIFTSYASDSVLLTGGFGGEYSMLNLNSEFGTAPTEGVVSLDQDSIVTHIQAIRNRRTSGPTAAFCSNDRKLRLLDITTNKWISVSEYPAAINCSATSPDGRLRVIVGDTNETMITDAERGDVIVSMRHHTEDAFSCAWADDGHHVATGAEDGKIVIYDARNWSAPVTTLDCIAGCARSLQFANTGTSAGTPALVVGEADDIVSIYDTRDWTSGQHIALFGAVAGVQAIGRELLILCSDINTGGLMVWRNDQGTAGGEEDEAFIGI